METSKEKHFSYFSFYKFGWFLILLLVSAQSLAVAEILELHQTIDLKWGGLKVGTLRFDMSAPLLEQSFVERLDASGADVSGEGKPSITQIEVTGETRGPLRWVKDYKVTIKFGQIQGVIGGSLLSLEGNDNGFDERREIVFLPGQLPRIDVFIDSSASHGLAPQSHWLGDTNNILIPIKKIFLAAAGRGVCGGELWGFDGKRRYRLDWRQVGEGVDHERRAPEFWNAEEMRYLDCEITLRSSGLEQVEEKGERKRVLQKGMLRVFWPFGSGDRTMSFSLNSFPDRDDPTVYRVNILEIRIKALVGTIIGRPR